jgi:hypothetical protein
LIRICLVDYIRGKLSSIMKDNSIEKYHLSLRKRKIRV